MKWKLESILTSVNGKSIPHISRLQYSTGSLAEVYRQYHNTKIDKEVTKRVTQYILWALFYYRCMKIKYSYV